MRVQTSQVWFHPMYKQFELDFFKASLEYSVKILCRGTGDLTDNQPVPDVIGYRRLLASSLPDGKVLYDLQHTDLSSQCDLLKSLEYIVDVEHMTTVFLDSLRSQLVEFEENFKTNIPRAQILHTVETYRKKLLKMLSI